MIARVVISDDASADEAGILIALNIVAGLRTAAEYRGHFRDLYDRLAAHPGIGAPRPALGRDIRIGIVSPYIILYRYTDHDETVAVLRIVHGRRRITGKLLSGSS